MASLSLSDVIGSMRVPVTVSSSTDTLDKVDDPFESEDVEHKMDHEVERVLREWDTSKQRITNNSLRIRPTLQLSNSTPTSPFTQRRKRVSNSLSNLAMKDPGTPQRKHFDFPEINITRREDSRLNSSADFEVVNDDAKTPLYIHCPNSGQRIFKMEFDTEGYPHDDITVKVTGDKLVIHALQKDIVEGRVSTTEFCRKVKLPRDVNSRRLECYVAPDTGMLVVTAPVIRSSSSSSTSSPAPHSPSAMKHEALNTPFVRSTSIGKTMYLNAEVGRIFKSDDVTVKVIGQNKLLISALREENENGNKLNASLTREFLLPDKIMPKTIQAGLSNDGVLKLAAMVDSDEQTVSNGGVHIDYMDDDQAGLKTPMTNGVKGK